MFSGTDSSAIPGPAHCQESTLFCGAISTRGRQRWNLPWISSVRANVSDLLPSSFPVLRDPGCTVTLHSSVVSRRVGLFLLLSLLSLSPVTASHTQITLPHLSFQGRARTDTLDLTKLAFQMETVPPYRGKWYILSGSLWENRLKVVIISFLFKS